MTISIACRARRSASAAAIAATLVTLPLSSFSAVAADMSVAKAPPIVAAAPWSGFYIGVHGGGGWGNSRVEDPGFALSYNPLSLKSRGWFAGGQVGADWQFGSFVVGGELDGSWGSISGNIPPDPANAATGVSVEYRALATGTGRVGYAAGNLLGYAKGGVAWANIDMKSQPLLLGPDIDHSRTGLTAGAGLEWLMLANLSARLEYDYVYFGADAMSLGNNRLSPVNVDHALQLVKFGLNWRFTGDYLAARY